MPRPSERARTLERISAPDAELCRAGSVTWHAVGNVPDAAFVAFREELTVTDRLDRDLAVELHDVFNVLQITRGTALESGVGVDIVDMDPGQTSQVHRHNLSETVLYFVEGHATVEVDGHDHQLMSGDRLRIAKGEFHGVRTAGEGCRFISVQMPPILNKTTGFRDLEPRDG